MAASNSLISFIDQQTSRQAPDAVMALADELLKQYGDSVQAILFYGSCFRTGDASEGLVDLYVLVDHYRSAYGGSMLAFLNWLLPPNVFYLEMPYQGNIIRSKYTIFSLSDFQKGTSMRWFHSYLWGRFAQPTGLVYARSEQAAELVKNALAQAVQTFMTRALPAVSEQFDARELWSRGLLLSYQSELRSEQPQKLGRLFDAGRQYFEDLSRAAVALLPYDVQMVSNDDPVQYRARIPSNTRFLNRLAWRLRNIQGKLLSVARLFKALFTFRGGVDYILWKVERHSGVAIEDAPRLRRIPVIGLGIIFWRLYRRGAFR
jgi:hypothetical protein